MCAEDLLPRRPRARHQPRTTASELVCRAVAQMLLGIASERHFLRFAITRLGALFPYLPKQPGYNKRLRALAPQIVKLLSTLPRSGERGDPRADVHRDPGDLLAEQLAVAACKPARSTKPSSPAAARTATARRIAQARPSNVAKKPAPAVSLLPPEADELRADRDVEAPEQRRPAAVEELAQPFGRADEIGEEERRQHTVRLGRWPHPPAEFLDLVEQQVGVLGPPGVVRFGELDEAARPESARR